MNQHESRDNKPDVWSISRLNNTVRDNLQRDPRLQGVWVEGEILNLTYHASGHIYLSLKDDQSVINCTFFRNANARYKNIRMREGMKIIAQGSVSVYIPRGNYQFNISRIMLAGEGELRMKIEELKKKLYHEGLFDPARKKRLPYLPVTIGVATAPTGAAFQDIIRVSRARFPDVNILLAPCLVQGEGAAASIVEAIQALNKPELEVDVIIAGRGGGSFEDLLAFNEESVVRAYAASKVPIISAVGHEIDNPLSDLAADAFAATPSAAAEHAIPVFEDLLERVNEYGFRLRVALKNKHRVEKERLVRLFKSHVYVNPLNILATPRQNLDYTFDRLKTIMGNRVNQGNIRLQKYNTLPVLYEKNLADFKRRFARLDERLVNFSPLGTLGRGYALARDAKKNIVRSYKDVNAGDEVEVLLHEGSIRAKVESTDKEGIS